MPQPQIQVEESLAKERSGCNMHMIEKTGSSSTTGNAQGADTGRLSSGVPGEKDNGMGVRT
jgi:hypothetical protein